MTSDQHIFITGGTGFVGAYLIRELRSRGYERITAMRRASSRVDMLMDYDVDWVEMDLFDYEQMVEVLTDVDVVIHSAALISYASSAVKDMLRVNVEGTALLLEAARIAGVGQLLYVSSVAALGRSELHQTITEDLAYKSGPLNTAYGWTKHLGEMEVFRAIEEGLNATIINPAMIMGGGYWDTGTPRLVDRIYKGLKFYPLGHTGFVDVRDVARMSVEMLKRDLMGRRIICSSVSMPIRDVMNMISEGLGVKAPSIALTPWMRAVAWRGEWIRARLTGQPPQITKTTLATSARHFTFDHSRSLDQLDYQYIPFDQTIADTTAAYLERRLDGWGWIA